MTVKWHFLGVFCLLDLDPSCGSRSKIFPQMWIHSAKKKLFLLFSFLVGFLHSPNLPSYVKMAGNFVQKWIFSVGKLRTHLKFGVRSGKFSFVFYHSKELEFRQIILKNFVDKPKSLWDGFKKKMNSANFVHFT